MQQAPTENWLNDKDPGFKADWCFLVLSHSHEGAFCSVQLPYNLGARLRVASIQALYLKNSEKDDGSFWQRE